MCPSAAVLSDSELWFVERLEFWGEFAFETLGPSQTFGKAHGKAHGDNCRPQRGGTACFSVLTMMKFGSADLRARQKHISKDKAISLGGVDCGVLKLS